MNVELTEDNFVMYAIKHYDNPNCSGMNEFLDDLKRFKYLKRLFRKYSAGKGLKERLIVNHLIILYNLFGAEAATKMLFFKIETRFWGQLKTFLVFLNYMPENVYLSRDCNISNNDIPIDQAVANSLRRI